MDYLLWFPTHLLITGLFLGLLTLIFLSKFVIPAFKQWQQLSQVLWALKGSALENERNPQALDKAFPAEGELAHLWREYKKTLYPMTLESADGIATMRWASTAPAEVVWNSQLAVDQRINAEFFKHLPGIFTGMGIIGTFFGLIEGLRSFEVSSNADVVRGSLESLMHSVGEAFVISAIAIGLAIVVTFIEKSVLSGMYAKVDAIAANLDRRFQAAVAEKYLEMTATHTEEAATQLKHLKGELLRDLRPILQELSDKHSETLERLTIGLQEKFVETSRVQIDAHRQNSDALCSTLFGAITNSLAEPMKDIRSAVQQASGDQSATAVKMLQDVMTSFSQKLNDLFGGQISGINELNQRTAQTMQDAVSKLNELVLALQDAGRQSSTTMAEQMARAINDMEARQASITENTQALVAQLREAILKSQQTTADGVRSSSEEMARRMAEAIEKMEQRQDSINERTREFVAQIKALVDASQNETSSKLQLTLQTLGEQLAEMLKRFQTAQNDARKREEEASGRTQATVASLSGSVEALVQQIAQASTKMEESISTLRSTTTSAISGLNEGATQVNTASRNFTVASEKVTGAMNQATSLTTKLTSLSGDMAVAATSLQQGIQDYKDHRDTISKLVSDLNNVVANARTDASMTSDALRRIEAATRALGNAQAQTEEFMNGVADVLAKAHESFREAMLRTVRDSNREFDQKLSFAVALLGNSIKELDDVLSTATPSGRSK